MAYNFFKVTSNSLYTDFVNRITLLLWRKLSSPLFLSLLWDNWKMVRKTISFPLFNTKNVLVKNISSTWVYDQLSYFTLSVRITKSTWDMGFLKRKGNGSENCNVSKLGLHVVCHCIKDENLSIYLKCRVFSIFKWWQKWRCVVFNFT